MKILIPILILIFSFSAFGQVRKTVTIKKPSVSLTKPAQTDDVPTMGDPVQKVLIEKTNGDKITALFLKGDASSIYVGVSGTTVKIPISEISTLRFGNAAAVGEAKPMGVSIEPLPIIVIEPLTPPVNRTKYFKGKVNCYFINNKGEKTYVDTTYCEN